MRWNVPVSHPQDKHIKRINNPSYHEIIRRREEQRATESVEFEIDEDSTPRAEPKRLE